MSVQLSAFPVEYAHDPSKQIVTTGEKFEALVRWLKTRKRIVVDYETSGLAWFQHASLCGVGLASWDDQGRIWNAYVPVRHLTGSTQLEWGRIAPAIADLLADEGITKAGHNLKFEDHFTRKEGLSIRGPRYDTLVAARLYNDNAPLKLEKRAELDLGIKDAMSWNHRLNAEVARLAHQNGMKLEDYRWRYGYSEVDPTLCGIYCCTDTDHAAKLMDFYEAWGVSRHYSRIWATEMRLTEVLCDMEEAGMPIDVPYLQAVSAQTQEAKGRLEEQINQLMGGYRFNVGSDDELRSTMYHVLGLRWEKRTKGNQLSVDREVLESFADSIAVMRPILAWRDAEKINSTYTTSILELLDSKNRVHGNFKSTGTNCLPAGELVLTDRGYLPVESVPVGALVLTHEGRPQKVLNSGLSGHALIYEVVLADGNLLRVSANHPFWTERGWVEARDLLTLVDRVAVIPGGPEVWKTIGAWPEFEVSSWGRVRHGVTKRARRVYPHGKWGHLKVMLTRGGAQKRGVNRKDVKVHRLVAVAFGVNGVGPEIRHLDGIAWNNIPSNLVWGTSLENKRDAMYHGTMTRQFGGQAKLSREIVLEVRTTPRTSHSDIELARRYGVSRELIRDVRLGKRWRTFPENTKRASFAWSPVVSLKMLGQAPVYGLVVAVDHSHVTGGMVTHNTGRLSCSEPNLQNLSTDDDDRSLAATGKKVKDGGSDPWSIRRAFTVRGSDWARVTLDYSQIELRVLAYYSKDPIMTDAFLRGEDLHDRTAKEVGARLGIDAIPRRIAKVIAFGLSYCMSEKGLSAQAKIPEQEAAVFLQAFFQRYAGISTFRQELWATARRQGCQWSNIFGRTRRLPDMKADEFWKRKRAERQMIGSAIQGTAAELTKESLVRLADWFKAEKIPALLVSTVHDEIQIDCPRECLPQVVKGSKRIMEAFPEFHPIPIIAEPAVTFTTWADKVPYKEESAHG